MAKTCRTCAALFLIHACEEHEHGWPSGRLYWEQGIDEATDCPRWRALPEPPLVDEFAKVCHKALKQLGTLSITHSHLVPRDLVQRLDEVLARYQMEIGSGEQESQES